MDDLNLLQVFPDFLETSRVGGTLVAIVVVIVFLASGEYRFGDAVVGGDCGVPALGDLVLGRVSCWVEVFCGLRRCAQVPAMPAGIGSAAGSWNCGFGAW